MLSQVRKHYLAYGHTFMKLGYAVALDLFLTIAIELHLFLSLHIST